MASHKPRLARRIVFMLIFAGVIYGGVIGLNRFIGAKIRTDIAATPLPVVSVSVAKAVEQTWPIELRAVGSLRALQGTTLTAQSPGTVTGLHIESGQKVSRGQLLVQLNDNVVQARLANDQARLVNSRQRLERQRKLYARKVTSEGALQDAEAAYREARASVQADRAALANLQVRAPFDGHLGIRDVSLGQYVSPGTPVVNIQQWAPLRVQFQVPQRDLPSIAVGDRIALDVDGLPGKSFTGKVTALGAAVDTATRNIRVEGVVANPKTELRPGMFARVVVHLSRTRKIVAVPRTAISFNTYGEYIYVVEPASKGETAVQRIVKKIGRAHV